MLTSVGTVLFYLEIDEYQRLCEKTVTIDLYLKDIDVNLWHGA
jgi:hypothetical protein